VTATTATCRLEIDADNIGWLTLDKPDSSTNTLSRQVLEDLQTQVTSLEQQSLRGWSSVPASLRFRGGRRRHANSPASLPKPRRCR
jgi:hypothetical protein